MQIGEKLGAGRHSGLLASHVGGAQIFVPLLPLVVLQEDMTARIVQDVSTWIEWGGIDARTGRGRAATRTCCFNKMTIMVSPTPQVPFGPPPLRSGPFLLLL